MKKTVSLLLTLLLCGALSAQQARSLSVWSGGASSEYAVYETDSMEFRDDGSMILHAPLYFGGQGHAQHRTG